jgi:mono/diheme cytochrome c family protein
VTPRIKLFSATLIAILISCGPLAAHALGVKGKRAEMAGAVLFRDKGCAHCHGVGGVGTKKAPSLVDIRSNTLWTPAKMTDQILNGGQKMPPFRDSLTDEEAAQLIAYLRAKKRPVPPPAPDAAPPPPQQSAF